MAEPINSGQSAAATPTEPAVPAAEATPAALQPDIEATVACDFGISDAIEQFDTIDQMAWYSHEIVVATVVEKLGSRKVPGGPTPGVNYYIVTDYEILVDEQIRGATNVVDQPTLTVAAWGGTVDGCTQTWDGWPPFEIGDRALFFLREIEGSRESGAPVYDVFGRGQGYWSIDKDGVASTNAVHLDPGGRPVPLDQLLGTVRSALEDGPPADEALNDRWLVPIDEAPIQPTPTEPTS